MPTPGSERAVWPQSLIVQVSGTLAEAPAFWVPRVDVTRRYQRIHGHRVSVEIDSVAHIRLLGSSRFTMTTSYEMLDGENVGGTGSVPAQPVAAAARPAGIHRSEGAGSP